MRPRNLTWGPLVLELATGDILDFAYNPEQEHIRLITRTPEQIRDRKGSMFSIVMDPAQLRTLADKAVALAIMIENGRVPGDRPAPQDVRPSVVPHPEMWGKLPSLRETPDDEDPRGN